MVYSYGFVREEYSILYMTSIREKISHICVDEENFSIDLWTHTQRSLGYQNKKNKHTFVMSMCLSEFKCLFAFFQMNERCRKKSLVRENPY